MRAKTINEEDHLSQLGKLFDPKEIKKSWENINPGKKDAPDAYEEAEAYDKIYDKLRNDLADLLLVAMKDSRLDFEDIETAISDALGDAQIKHEFAIKEEKKRMPAVTKHVGRYSKQGMLMKARKY